MSATITAATWTNPGTSGLWTDATKWTPASVPGASNNVLIGSTSVNTTTPWVVTVAGTQAANALAVEMGTSPSVGATGGTLSITGTLDVTGAASIGYLEPAGTVELTAGAALSVGGNTVSYGATFLVNGGTITNVGYFDLGGSDAVLQGNGVWNSDSLFFVGQAGFAAMTVGGAAGAGTINATGTLAIGADGTNAHQYSEGIGTLNVIDGSVVNASGTLSIVNNSLLSVDSLSAVNVGGASGPNNGVNVGSGGTLALEWAKIAGNVVDAGGAITALVNPNAATLNPGGPGSVGPGPVITGTLSGTGSVLVGSGYTMEVGSAAGFTGSVTIDPTAILKIDAGAPPTGSFSMAGGTVDLKGLTFGSGQALGYNAATGALTVGTDTLNVGTGLSLARFSDATDATGATPGTLVMETACYAAGTRIATEHGEAAVEMLRPGDRVRTHGGRIAPVRWVGQTTVDVRVAPHAAPVCITAGAFAPGLPHRDLLVSGDHAIALDGVLIPAHKLANGATIRPLTSVAGITYVHVELDRHDLLLAEGLPAESYLDTGNRGQFQGAAAPRFDADPQATALRIFAEQGCAPLVLRGPLLDAARDRLRARAEALGWRLVSDPGLTLQADRPGAQFTVDGPDTLRVQLPAGVRVVRLLSRRFVPAMLDAAIADGRQLGAALDVDLDGVWLDNAAFGDGWYPSDTAVRWRWTDGAATLLLPGHAQPSVLTVHVMRCGARYWVAQEAMAQQAA